jgi:hypothetical protein
MRLHNQVTLQAAIIQEHEQSINELRRYLNSSKFSIEVSVNKNDIFLRLDEAQRYIDRLQDELHER